MKSLNIFYTWLITLLAGWFILAIVTTEISTSSFFTLIAAACSLPYLIIMLSIVKKIKSFLTLQAIHLSLSCLTALVIFGMDENFVSDLYWAAFCYFGIGFIVQLIWWYSVKPEREE